MCHNSVVCTKFKAAFLLFYNFYLLIFILYISLSERFFFLLQYICTNFIFYLQVSPVRLAFCNASTECCCQGGSLFINEVALRLYVQQVNCEYPSPDKIIKSSSNNWVEVGVIGLGPITADISELCGNKNQSKDQYHYLSFYDGRSKRLWFLWESNELKSKLSVDRMKTKKCGCVGGCDFFGKNVNGVRFFTTQVLDATVKSSNHYGSRSLWGGQSTTGEKVKEYLRKLSGFIPNSNLNSNKSVDEKTKRSSEIFADQEGKKLQSFIFEFDLRCCATQILFAPIISLLHGKVLRMKEWCINDCL